jgi:hypothetical protein
MGMMAPPVYPKINFTPLSISALRTSSVPFISEFPFCAIATAVLADPGLKRRHQLGALFGFSQCACPTASRIRET